MSLTLSSLDYALKISQEFAPLDQNLLPELERVNNKLMTDSSNIPHIEPYHVYEKIKKMNIPDSVVPGDFPPRIWKEFAVELSEPVARITEKILQTGKWPESGKMEFVVVIEKLNDPRMI